MFNIFYADCTGREGNCLYPPKADITDAASLAQAVRFDYVCAEASKGIAQSMLAHETPIGFGLLTCDSIDQAIERAGSKAGNKGVEAAAAMLETIRVLEQL